MILRRVGLPAAAFFGLMTAGVSLCAGQTPAQPAVPAQPAAAPAPSATAPAPAQPAAAAPAAQPAPSASASSVTPPSDGVPAEPVGLANTEPEKKTYTVPAGTKVLLELRSGINTKSARAGDGVYLSSMFPVVVGNKVMIPNGVYVQGVVDRVQRGGMKAKAQLDMHFTSIIFPNGSVVEIPGGVDNVPGSSQQKVKNDQEGTIEQNGDKGRNAGRTAEIALPTGAGVGTIGGASEGHPIEGGLAGLGAGAAAVGIVALFTKNADVNLPPGTQVEMVLQRPLMLEDANLGGVGDPGTAPNMVPSANQQKPITQHRPRIMCPLGGMGCE
jgi:hypothetical protein